ncbi:hypothetical protein SK128_008047, partial [Halocaridina rubra]
MTHTKGPRYSLTAFLLLVTKLLGGFPFSWHYKEGQLEVKRSVIATMWSVGVMVVMMTMSLSSIIYAPNNGTGMTAKISTSILNYVTYSILFLFFPYFILRGSSLASILSRMGENDVDIRRSAVNSKDVFQAIYVPGTIGSLGIINYFAIKKSINWLDNQQRFNYSVSAGVSDLFSELMMATMSLLCYYLLKHLSLKSEESVSSLCQDFESAHASCENQKEGGIYRLKPSMRQWFASEGRLVTNTCIYPSTSYTNNIRKVESFTIKAVERQETEEVKVRCDEEAFRSVIGRLIALDEVVLKMVDYAGPLIVMILLNGTVNATTMLYLNSIKMDYYYIVYITLKTLCVVNITYIPDSLGRM